jgi:hypothetical protein
LTRLSTHEFIASIFTLLNQSKETSQFDASKLKTGHQLSSSLSGIQLLLESLFNIANCSFAYASDFDESAAPPLVSSSM